MKSTKETPCPGVPPEVAYAIYPCTLKSQWLEAIDEKCQDQENFEKELLKLLSSKKITDIITNLYIQATE